MADHLRTELVVGALEMAIWNRRPGDGLIHHSDHGCQYTSLPFGERCQAVGIRCSMGSVGDCYDNAMAESFFATLECELLARQLFRTQLEAHTARFEYLDVFYNRQRRPKEMGYPHIGCRLIVICLPNPGIFTRTSARLVLELGTKGLAELDAQAEIVSEAVNQRPPASRADVLLAFDDCRMRMDGHDLDLDGKRPTLRVTERADVTYQRLQMQWTFSNAWRLDHVRRHWSKARRAELVALEAKTRRKLIVGHGTLSGKWRQLFDRLPEICRRQVQHALTAASQVCSGFACRAQPKHDGIAKCPR
jgi:integrase-like protein